MSTSAWGGAFAAALLLASPDDFAIKAAGSTTPRTLSERARDQVNVKDFGAKGDGVSDDTGAIQAAIDSLPLNVGNRGILTPRGFANGGEVLIPGGRYKVTQTIRLRRGVRLSGGSRESSQILSFTSGSVFQYLDAGREVPDEVTIENLSIWQDDRIMAIAGAAIEVNTGPASTQAVTFRGSGLVVRGTYHGILLQGGIASSLRDSLITNTVSHGVYVTFGGTVPVATTSTTFQNVYSQQSVTGDGFRVERGSYISFVGCASDSNARHGYSVEGGDSYSFVACGAEQSGQSAVHIRNAGTNFVQVRAIFSGNVKRHGVTLANAPDTIIQGSRMSWTRGATGYGVHLEGPSPGTVVLGSTFIGAKAPADGPVLQLDHWAFGGGLDATAQVSVAGPTAATVDTAVMVAPTFTRAGSQRSAAVSAQAATADSLLAYPAVTGVEVLSAARSGGSTISRLTGVAIGEQVGARQANTDLLVGATTPANGDYALYVQSPRESVFKGPLRLVHEAGPRLMAGSGSPEGIVPAPAGSLFLRTDGGPGSALYVKERGTGSTGWVSK